MSQEISFQVAVDLAPAVEAIATASARVALDRAAQVARASGGAIEATTEQVAAIQAKAADEMFAELREQIRDVARVFIININEGN